MKVQATVLLAFQAKSLAEAGAVLDDVLARARDALMSMSAASSSSARPAIGRSPFRPSPRRSVTNRTSRLRRARETARSLALVR
jgi:hypothetical protein